MTYNAQEARQDLLRDLGEAIDALSAALGSLGEAYEGVDEQTADVLEEQLFRPLQLAYGTAQRTHTQFAQRYGLPPRSFEMGGPGAHSGDPRVHLERAVEAVERADAAIAELQDSLMPVEVGDQELREGLSRTRTLIGPLGERGRRMVSTLGR